MILIVDNYDSFTYNLVDLVRRHSEAVVYRNDELALEDVPEIKPTGILISPGPGRPDNSGISLTLVHRFKGKIPILGVCLGHQIMGEVLGIPVVHASRPMHGHTSDITHERSGLFQGLPSPLQVMRYHSLILAPENLPQGVSITAQTKEGEIMGLSHKTYLFEGVQFHPESILSEGGSQLMKNWLEMIWS